MTWLDFTIIYLTCGMPFAVFYFFQYRNEKSVWLKSLLIILLWIPFAFRLFHSYITKRLINYEFDEKTHLDSLQKKLENFFLEVKTDISLFEFRETIERYIGLTLECRNSCEEVSDKETEFYRISNHSNLKLGSRCLHRRNQNLLFHHQTLASRDFLKILKEVFAESSVIDEVSLTATEIVEILADESLQKKLSNELNFWQNEPSETVSFSEKFLWNSKSKSLIKKKISLTLQASPTTNKD